MADFTAVNPATGEEIASYPNATQAEAEQALSLIHISEPTRPY